MGSPAVGTEISVGYNAEVIARCSAGRGGDLGVLNIVLKMGQVHFLGGGT